VTLVGVPLLKAPQPELGEIDQVTPPLFESCATLAVRVTEEEPAAIEVEDGAAIATAIGALPPPQAVIKARKIIATNETATQNLRIRLSFAQPKGNGNYDRGPTAYFGARLAGGMRRRVFGAADTGFSRPTSAFQRSGRGHSRQLVTFLDAK
jgi:hypothetical protein